MSTFVRIFPLKLLLLVSIGYCLASCAVNPDEQVGAVNHQNETKTPTLTTDLNSDEDPDGDSLVGDKDPNPLEADLPKVSFNIESSRLSFLYQDNSGVKTFKPVNYSDEKVEFQDSRKNKALVAIGNFIKTRNDGLLRESIDVNPSLMIRPLSPKDSVINEIDLNKRGVRSNVENSAEVELTGTVIINNDSKFLTNAHYVSLLKENQILGKTLLGERGVDISLSATAASSIFTINFPKINTQSLRNLITAPNDKLELSLSEFTLKRDEKEVKYSDLIKKVQEKTLTVMIINGDDIDSHFIVHEGPLRSALLKISGGTELVEEDGEISTYLGQSSTLNPTTSLSDIEEDSSGKWFMLSSRAMNLGSKVGAGDSVTLIYATGEEIASAFLQYSQIGLNRFTGSSLNVAKQSIDHIKSLYLFVEGVKRFGSRARSMNTSQRRYPNDCHGHEEGDFLTNFEEGLSIDDAGTLGRLSLTINGTNFSLNDGFYQEEKYSQFNLSSYLADSDKLKSLSTLYINTGNNQGTTPVRLTRNTCYNSAGQYAYSYSFGDVPIKTYFQYNLNFLIEHY